MALSGAQRQARLRAKQAAGTRLVRYRRPADRRSRPKQWADAVEVLTACLEAYRQWRENLPAGLADSEIAIQLDAVLALEELVEQLRDAELPRGFGRDRASGGG